MSLKLYVRDNFDGTVHEYGTNPHDSLMVMDDGSLHYLNLQNGSGTLYPSDGYSFCLENGRDPRDPDLQRDGDPFLDIGGNYFGNLKEEASGTTVAHKISVRARMELHRG